VLVAGLSAEGRGASDEFGAGYDAEGTYQGMNTHRLAQPQTGQANSADGNQIVVGPNDSRREGLQSPGSQQEYASGGRTDKEE
jgi:hypothetical protein